MCLKISLSIYGKACVMAFSSRLRNNHRKENESHARASKFLEASISWQKAAVLSALSKPKFLTVSSKGKVHSEGIRAVLVPLLSLWRWWPWHPAPPLERRGGGKKEKYNRNNKTQITLSKELSGRSEVIHMFCCSSHQHPSQICPSKIIHKPKND